MRTEQEILKDFEELKELNQFNYKSVKCEEHNYKLLENEYIKLEKENEKLKERYKHRAETSNDLCKEVRQYEKAIEILKIKRVSIHILLETNSVAEYNFCVDYNQLLTQEEYELLKEVLGNAKDN